ncbi:amino acid ABC transporter [Mesorhizobium loti]|uniref:Amino acid ABC transporter n=1 Tax=Mesorhizobium jarvisii TaxID=1777867 RepID=A0A6M7TRB0_9HYPH|nr:MULTISPECIES: transporter substrate-binding domain-containing protein [Mesorhizobium]AID27882.1 transporter substrate-binding domain-containing protein [Mesorhizobium huakuii 7653R]ANN61097.1 amino acid ABC transporter [Mesorhizobium loti NZP2037]MCH4555963.1 transporter substrate-binding domain-containing protein [Mesorhizobium jarvisii]OBQ63082.1 amino acid ABC transporter [Mesorhizobium loti]QKC66658.1 amino acid ABC transporter [Mesorhizobium jarvisii]
MAFQWRFLVLASLLIAALPLAPGARAAEPQVPVLWDAKERLPKPDLSALPRLRFLTTTDFPPFNFLDGAGKLSGFHIDLARAICAELGIADKCQIQALPWGELEGALEKGEGEAIIAGIAATPQSRQTYAFSRSYLQFPARFITPKNKAFAEPVFDKLRSKRVGVLAGSAHERMLRDYFNTVQIVSFDGPEALYGDLKAGKIDAAFGDGMRFAFWLGGSDAGGCCRFAGGPYLAPEYLGTGMAIATRADNPALAAAIDYALQEISMKGTFAEFYLRYFPVSFF